MSVVTEKSSVASVCSCRPLSERVEKMDYLCHSIFTNITDDSIHQKNVSVIIGDPKYFYILTVTKTLKNDTADIDSMESLSPGSAVATFGSNAVELNGGAVKVPKCHKPRTGVQVPKRSTSRRSNKSKPVAPIAPLAAQQVAATSEELDVVLKF